MFDRDDSTSPDPDNPDDRHDADSTGSPEATAPKVNKGRHIAHDDLRQHDLSAALADYEAAYTHRGVGEASMIRALAAAYSIAYERAQAVITDPNTRTHGDSQQIFSWHFASVLGEFAIASHDSERSLTNRGHEAHLLATEFPEWVAAIEQGRVDLRHVRSMLKHLRAVDDEKQAAFAARVLTYATTHTPRQTDVHAEQLAATIAAAAFEEAHERARQQRHVTITHDGLGMATLTAYLPSELAAPIGDLLDKRARELRELDKAAGEEHRAAVLAARQAGRHLPAEFVRDTRTFPQMRADTFIETLLCATPGESRVSAVVHITIPAKSLVEGRDGTSAPALLDGMLPMSFDEARQFAATAPALQRILTHPVTGQPICVDTYEPDQALRRFLRVRDRTCRFPGCTKPASLSEMDHTTPYREGGKTSRNNLAALCKRHHVQKHQKPWTVTNHGGGVLEWRTPLDQVATTTPEPYGVRFTPTQKLDDFGNSATMPETEKPTNDNTDTWQSEDDPPGGDPTPDFNADPPPF